MKNKEAAASLTLALDCNSCRTTRRLCLCSSHRSPGEKEEGKGETERGSERGLFVNHECQDVPEVPPLC